MRVDAFAMNVKYQIKRKKSVNLKNEIFFNFTSITEKKKVKKGKLLTLVIFNQSIKAFPLSGKSNLCGMKMNYEKNYFFKFTLFFLLIRYFTFIANASILIGTYYRT